MLQTFRDYITEVKNFKVHLSFDRNRDNEAVHKVNVKAATPEDASQTAHAHLQKNFGVRWKTKIHKVEES